MSRIVVCALLSFGLAGPTALSAQSDALVDFGALLVGTWEGEGSRQIIEWGVGNKVLKTASYFGQDGAWTLVSEGMWYWNPDAQRIEGRVVAIDMPVELFEYVTRVDGDTVVHDLTSYGEMGGRYVERWTVSADGYEWQLEQDGQRVMGGSYSRVR